VACPAVTATAMRGWSGCAALVPVTNAIAGIDLAGSKQMVVVVVVTDHDSKVIARRAFRCRAWDLGSALDWPLGVLPRTGGLG
jgi:transposase